MTGERIATTLIHTLQERDGDVGFEAMCIGGRQRMAMVL
jgi:acetyl-CoA C-acetyltransferase